MTLNPSVAWDDASRIARVATVTILGVAIIAGLGIFGHMLAALLACLFAIGFIWLIVS